MNIVFDVQFGALIVGIVAINLIIAYFGVSAFSNLKQQVKALEKINEAHEKQLDEAIKEEGDRYLYMALSQAPDEPHRYTLLKKCVDDHDHPIAAILLGTAYRYGVTHNDKRIIEADIEKAVAIYEKFCNPDAFGIFNWHLGFYYRNNLIEKSKKIADKGEREKIAFEYFEKSAEKEFPKAFNSLGMCYMGGHGTSFDPLKGHENYKRARDLGDVYGAITAGSIYEKYYDEEKSDEKKKAAFIDAVECYTTAKDQDSPEGYMRLAMIHEKNLNLISITPKEIASYYLKATHVKNKISAISYYRLGELLLRYGYLQDDKEIRNSLNLDKDDDPVESCYRNSNDIFLKLLKKKPKISEKPYYIEFTEGFERIIGECENSALV